MFSMEQEFALKPDAVSSLANRIEANLKKSKNGKPTKIGQTTPSTKGKPVIKEKPNRGASVPKCRSEPSATLRGNGDKAVGKPKSNPDVRGKKRQRDGQLKEPSNGNLHISSKTTTKGSHDKADKASLEQELLAVGGSKDDLDLIEGYASDSEIEGDASTLRNPTSKGLEKELQRFVQELGIKDVPQEVQDDSNLEVDEDESAVPNIGDKAPETSIKATLAPQRTKHGKAFPSFVCTLAWILPFLFMRIANESLQDVEPSAEWYNTAVPSLSSSGTGSVALPPELIARIHEYAKSLLDSENERYATQNTSANSAQQFYSTIMSSGTLSDKISALTLSIQESPLHNMKTLDALVGLARKRSRGQAVEVLGALKDLFGLGSVLPPNRKLRNFATQPDLSAAFSLKLKWTASDTLPRPLTKAHLILWAFEDWLKGIYFEILKILETWSNDEVVFARGKAVDYICQLLKEKPEQEANLLRLLVNKLGDNDKKIASKTSYNILQLETAHPLMKPIIVSAIESDLLFRPGQSLHAQYYAVITLNQTVLSGKEEDLVKKLLDIYFSLFAKLLAKPDPKTSAEAANVIKLNQKGEIQGGGGPAGKAAVRKAALKEKATTVEEDLREKMLSAVLTGVNRAVPYTNTNDEQSVILERVMR